MVEGTPNKLMVSKRRTADEPWPNTDLDMWYEIADVGEKKKAEKDRFKYGQPVRCKNSDNLVFRNDNGGYFFYTGTNDGMEFDSTNVNDAKSRIKKLKFLDGEQRNIPITYVSCVEKKY